MVDFDCGFTVYCYYLVLHRLRHYVDLCPINKWYMIIVVTWALVGCLIYNYTFDPQACGPRALGAYIMQTILAHVTIYNLD